MTVEALHSENMPWQVLLHRILERDGVEGVVCVVRVDDCWHTAWAGVNHAGLSMATIKLLNDVTKHIHGED